MVLLLKYQEWLHVGMHQYSGIVTYLDVVLICQRESSYDYTYCITRVSYRGLEVSAMSEFRVWHGKNVSSCTFH